MNIKINILLIFTILIHNSTSYCALNTKSSTFVYKHQEENIIPKKKTNSSECTALMKSACCGDINNIKSLLDLGVDIESKGKFERTALTWSAYYGHLDFLK